MTTILLVGQPDEGEPLCVALKAEGFRVAAAPALDDVATCTTSERPAAAIVRVDASIGDAGGVARRLKQQPETLATPLLILLDRRDDAGALAALEAGADDVADLDAPPALIVARLRRLLGIEKLRAVARLDAHLVQVGRVLTGVVHEIRGPLSVIRGSAELLRLQLESTDPLHSWIEPILRNADVLKARLEHLMATVRGGPPQLHDVDLTVLINEATTLFLKGIDRHGCRIRVDTPGATAAPISARADAGRLLLVLLSLLNNALDAMVAAGRTEGSVAIDVQVARRDTGNWALITLRDDGPGIPPTILDRVFEPFFSTKEQGSGYGLYLAAETMKEQGGRITVASPPGKGASFSLWLPIAASQSGSVDV